MILLIDGRIWSNPRRELEPVILTQSPILCFVSSVTKHAELGGFVSGAPRPVDPFIIKTTLLLFFPALSSTGQ